MNKSPKRMVTSNQSQKNRKKFGIVLFFVFLVLFGLIIIRFSYISIGKNVQNVNLSARTKKLYTETQTVKASRGTIYDANNDPIAEDTSTYSIYAVLNKKQESINGKPLYVTNKNKTAEVLSKYLSISKEKVLKQLNSKSFQVEFGAAGQSISLTTRNKIKAAHLTGINFIQRQSRLYPNGVFASHLIGNVTVPSDSTKSMVGNMGIEKMLNKQLTGTDGISTVQKDNYGYQVSGTAAKKKKATNGDDVYTTLDSRLQTLLETEMSAVNAEAHPASMNAVLMNAKTGAILAASQRPTYNPMTGKGLDKMWRDTLVQDSYEPGSTMKIFTMGASIDSGNYNGTSTYLSGKTTVDGITVPDWQTSGWGRITYNKGFALSSNVAMTHLEEQMGAKTWKKYINRFKFLKSTDSGLAGESSGSIQFSKAIEQADTSFGQGIQVTVFQMMRALSAISNNGKMLQPYFIDKVVNPNTNKVIQKNKKKVVGEPVSAATAKAVRKHMEDVVYKSYGIGSDFKISGVKVAAKTGTAQVSGGSSGYLSGDNSYLYSVAGMAPAKNPKYVLYITMKQPTLGSKTATQLMAQIFKPLITRALQDDKTQTSSTKSTKMTDLTGNSATTEAAKLTKKGYRVTTLGTTDKVTAQSPNSGTTLYDNQRIILATTGENLMPSLKGWSRADVVKIAKMLNIKLETTGSGYVTKQNITSGKAVNSGTTLKVKLGSSN